MNLTFNYQLGVIAIILINVFDNYFDNAWYCNYLTKICIREGNCQEGVITRIAVYVDELFEYKFLFVYIKMTKIDFSTFAIFFHLLN